MAAKRPHPLSGWEKLHIFTLMIRYSVWMQGKVDAFPRKCKFTLGDRIVHYLDTAMELMIKANSTKDPAEAAERIFEALVCIDMVTLKTRMACDLNAMSVHDKAFSDIHVAEIKENARRWRSYFLRPPKGRRGEGGGKAEAAPPESREINEGFHFEKVPVL